VRPGGLGEGAEEGIRLEAMGEGPEVAGRRGDASDDTGRVYSRTPVHQAVTYHGLAPRWSPPTARGSPAWERRGGDGLLGLAATASLQRAMIGRSMGVRYPPRSERRMLTTLPGP
jgi:hypothetical protein